MSPNLIKLRCGKDRNKFEPRVRIVNMRRVLQRLESVGHSWYFVTHESTPHFHTDRLGHPDEADRTRACGTKVRIPGYSGGTGCSSFWSRELIHSYSACWRPWNQQGRSIRSQYQPALHGRFRKWFHAFSSTPDPSSLCLELTICFTRIVPPFSTPLRHHCSQPGLFSQRQPGS
jgi:hypothetical protein